MKVDARQHTEFLKMLRHCEGTLMKVCLYFTDRSRDDFRDLYQEIACTLWEAWPTFRGESDLNTWVTRIALNVAGQEIRKRKRLPQFVELDESFYDTLADEATDLRYHRLYDLIDRLDDGRRTETALPLSLPRPQTPPRNRRDNRHHRNRRETETLPHKTKVKQPQNSRR